MNKIGEFALTLAIALALTSVSIAEDSPPSPLIVHEWGVLTVGHVGGSPILGTTDNFIASLPDFVTRAKLPDSPGPDDFSGHIVDKPVIHLYGAEGQKVEITVDVADGIPLVFFPKPDLTTKIPLTTTKGGHWGSQKQTQSMAWKFSLTKKEPGSLLKAPPEHWWNAARQIPSDFVIMDDDGTSERFLFYEGTTVENPTVIASVSEDSITVTNRDPADASSPVILIINDKGTRSGVYIDSIASNGVENLTGDHFKSWDEETLLANCRKQWVACGMTPNEALGIVESWRPELLNTPGFLLISRIPDLIYQKIFPIKVTPEPDELVRACLVFDSLPGQDGRKHWLPNFAEVGRATIADLSEAEFKTRLEAHANLVRFGEVMSPWVQEVLDDTDADPQAKMSAGTVIKLLTESPVCPHLPLSPVPGILHRGRVLPPIPMIEAELKIVPIP